jgi:hypothetical protein
MLLIECISERSITDDADIEPAGNDDIELLFVGRTSEYSTDFKLNIDACVVNDNIAFVLIECLDKLFVELGVSTD